MAKNIYDISALIDPGMYSIVSTIPDGEWFSRKPGPEPGPAITYYLTIGNAEQSYNHHKQDDIDTVNVFDISTNGTLSAKTPDWITYDSETKKLTISANNFTNVNGNLVAPEEREDTIEFTLEEDDTISAALKIKQMFQCNILPYGDVDLTKFAQSYEGGNVKKGYRLSDTTYSTNGTLIINENYNDENASWLHINEPETDSDGRKTYTFSMDKNELDPNKEVMSEQRVGMLHLTTKEDPDPLCRLDASKYEEEYEGVCLKVSQAANYYVRTKLNGRSLKTDTYDLEIPGDAVEGIDASLVTNSTSIVGVKSSTSDNWLSATAVKFKGDSGGTIVPTTNFTINASANTGDNTRTGTIIFSLVNESGDHNTLTFNVIQSFLYRLSLDPTTYEKEYTAGDLVIDGFSTNGTVKVKSKDDPDSVLTNGGLTVENNEATLSFYKNGNSASKLSTSHEVNVTFMLDEDNSKTVDVTIVQKPEYGILSHITNNYAQWSYKGTTTSIPSIETNGTCNVLDRIDWVTVVSDNTEENNEINTYILIPHTPYQISSDPTQSADGKGTRTGSISFGMNETNEGSSAKTITIRCSQTPEPYVLTKLRTPIYDDDYVENNTYTINLDTADSSTIDASLLGFDTGSCLMDVSVSSDNTEDDLSWIRSSGKSAKNSVTGTYLYAIDNFRIDVDENETRGKRAATVALTLYDNAIYKSSNGQTWNDYKFGSLKFVVNQPAPYYLEYEGSIKEFKSPANGELLQLDTFDTNGTIKYADAPDWATVNFDNTYGSWEINVSKNANTETSLSTERSADIVFYLEEDKTKTVTFHISQYATPGIIALGKSINDTDTYSADGSTYSISCGSGYVNSYFIYTNTSEEPIISGADWVSLDDKTNSSSDPDGLKKYMILAKPNTIEINDSSTYYNCSPSEYNKTEIIDSSNFADPRVADLTVSITSGNTTKSVNATLNQSKQYYILTWLNNPIISDDLNNLKTTCDITLDSSDATQFYPMLATNNPASNGYLYVNSVTIDSSSSWLSIGNGYNISVGRCLFHPGSGTGLYFDVSANTTNASRTGKIRFNIANNGSYNKLTFNITQPA